MSIGNIVFCGFLALMAYGGLCEFLEGKPARKRSKITRRQARWVKREKEIKTLSVEARALRQAIHEKKLRKRIRQNVIWALTGDDFGKVEIEGAILRASRLHPELALDSDGLYSATRHILLEATNDFPEFTEA